jgi:hypothetical protein
LIGYRDDPDFFVLIDVPDSVIDERIKWRRVCPLCQTSRNLKLLPTSKIAYDEKKKEFYLICDDMNCKGAKMLPKEGDNLGIKPIRERLKKDEKLIKQAFSLCGIPKILLRNSVVFKITFVILLMAVCFTNHQCLLDQSPVSPVWDRSVWFSWT